MENDLRELSAGGMVVRRSRAGAGLEVLMIRHRASGGWGFPKGWVEPGETEPQAAVREVEEESGVCAVILAELPATHYAFTNTDRKRINKTVTWYLMRYNSAGNQTHAFEVSAVEWMPIEAVHSRLTYKNDKDLFSVALALILQTEW